MLKYWLNGRRIAPVFRKELRQIRATLRIRHVTGLDETAKYKHIRTMTQAYSIEGGRPGLFSTIARTAFLAVAAIGGLFMLFFAATFALFAVAGIAVIGFLVFAFFWAKAKITGKPFGPKAMMGAQFEQMRHDMEAQMGGTSPLKTTNSNAAEQGPIVDAHRTPDGWSVDD